MELRIVVRGTVDVSIVYERFRSFFDNSNSWHYEKYSIGEEAIVKNNLLDSANEVELSIAILIEETEQDLVLIPARFKGKSFVSSKQVTDCVTEIISIIMNRMLDIVEYIKISKADGE